LSRPSDTLLALAATSRIANIPSVVSNVWVGIALGASTADWKAEGMLPLAALTLPLSGICLYVAGNFLNDWADRDWDATHRPERALPRGAFSPAFYLWIAIIAGLLGLGIAASVHLSCFLIASGIGIFILLYTRVHKRVAWSVVPMGLCRALLPVLGYFGCVTSGSSPFSPEANPITALAACAAGMFFHIIGLSLSARTESMAGPPSGAMRFARLLFPAAAGCMGFAAWYGASLPLVTCLAGLLPYCLWTALCLTIFRKPVPLHVSSLLAGIPLLDWILLLPVSLAMAGLVPGWTPMGFACLVIPPVAFLAGKLLQRLAPAT